MKKYRIKYNAENGEFTEKELRSSKHGGCDNIIVVSIVKPENGGSSYCFISMGEDGKPLSSIEIFKAWSSMASHLSDDMELNGKFRNITKDAFSKIRNLLNEKI